MIKVQCLRIGEQGDPLVTSWDCTCGSAYILRRRSGPRQAEWIFHGCSTLLARAFHAVFG